MLQYTLRLGAVLVGKALFPRIARTGDTEHNAHLAKQEQAEILKGLAYDYAICTVMADNTAQKHVLEKAGWMPLDQFYSARQDTRIEIWGKEINEGAFQ